MKESKINDFLFGNEKVVFGRFNEFFLKLQRDEGIENK